MNDGRHHMALRRLRAAPVSRAAVVLGLRLARIRHRPHRIEAVVEEISVIRHMIGQDNWQPRRIANVRTPEGVSMTVGLRDESEPGAVIELFEEGTAAFGKAK